MEKGNICEFFAIKSNGQKNTTISGYASVFGVVDSQNDRIIKGAFAEVNSLQVKLLWQHDVFKPIGVIMTLHEDDYGLKIEAEINNNTLYGKEASELIKQGAVDGLSVGFKVKDFEYDEHGIRNIKNTELMEISVVTFPANKVAGITTIKSHASFVHSRALDRLERLVHKLAS